MQHKYRITAITVALFFFMQTGQAISQQMPNSFPANTSFQMQSSDSLRRKDDRQLNEFAIRLEQIHATDKRAPAKIEELQNRVKKYHAMLNQRPYDASDIISDTVNLEHRISVKKKKIAEQMAASQKINAPKAPIAPTSILQPPTSATHVAAPIASQPIMAESSTVVSPQLLPTVLTTKMGNPDLSTTADKNLSQKNTEPATGEITPAFKDFQESNQMQGINITVKKGAGITKVVSLFNEEKISDIVSFQQSIGAMNPDITQTGKNVLPVTLSHVAALNNAMMAIIELYKTDESIDNIHYSAKIDIADEYGNSQIKDLFSFDFTKQLYAKINWDRMETSNFPKAAKNFKYSQWFMTNAGKELYR